MSLSDIVNVQIRVQQPPKNTQSFNYLLLVGSPPDTTGAPTPNRITVYSDLASIKDAGYTVNHNIYKAAAVAFGQIPQPTKIYVGVRNVVNEVKEDIPTVLDACLLEPGWYVWSNVEVGTGDLLAAATWTEANEKIYSFTTTEKTGCPIAPTAGTTSGFLRTHGWYSAVSPFLDVAVDAACLSYTAGTETWALKALGAVSTDLLSANDMNTLQGQNLNYYVTYADVGTTETGITLGGEWIDIIRFRDWLQNDMQLRIFNLLKKYPKIPFTNPGIALVENQMIASLKQGQRQNGIAPNQYDSEGNLVPGFVVTVPNAIDITDTDKAARTLNGCSFTAILAGAIQIITIQGNLVYSY